MWQENISKSNNLSEDKETSIGQNEVEIEKENETTPFYDEIVEEEEEQQEPEETQESPDNDSQTNDSLEESELVDFPGVIYRNKTGEIIFQGEDGETLEIHSLSGEAQNVLDSVKFPNDSYEVILKGNRTISGLTKNAVNGVNADINTRVPTIGFRYHFDVEKVELVETIAFTAEREEKENNYSTVLCGEIYIDAYTQDVFTDTSAMVISDTITNKSYLLYANWSATNPSNYLVLKSIETTLNTSGDSTTIGCVYSNESTYQDYEVSWRNLVNIEDYTTGW